MKCTINIFYVYYLSADSGSSDVGCTSIPTLSEDVDSSNNITERSTGDTATIHSREG